MKGYLAKEGFFYGFILALGIALIVLGLAAFEGRLPFAATDGRISIPMKEWEFMLFWMATAVSLYCRGAYDYQCYSETKTTVPSVDNVQHH